MTDKLAPKEAGEPGTRVPYLIATIPLGNGIQIDAICHKGALELRSGDNSIRVPTYALDTLTLVVSKACQRLGNPEDTKEWDQSAKVCNQIMQWKRSQVVRALSELREVISVADAKTVCDRVMDLEHFRAIAAIAGCIEDSLVAECSFAIVHALKDLEERRRP
jgi:hypothetical protein